MALEGSIKEFGLADILQLIYYQRKTGALVLTSTQDKVKLLFRDGNIVLAESKKRGIDSRVGRMLVKKGIVKSRDLRNAMEEQKKTNAKIGTILLKKGLASKEHLQEVLSFQITDTVFQLFSWKKGRYEFTPQGVPIDKHIALSLDTQHLLMEGLRLLDEWSLFEGKISMDSVFEKTGKTDVELTPDEKDTLKFVDGQADVGTVAGLSGIDSFQASKTLLGLLEKGLIAQKKFDQAEPAEPPAAPKPVRLGFLATAAVAVAFVVAIFTYLNTGYHLDEFRVSEDMDRLRFLIEARIYQEGDYPRSLEKTDPWGNPYLYTVTDNGFILKSTGPDGVPGTEDDVQ